MILSFKNNFSDMMVSIYAAFCDNDPIQLVEPLSLCLNMGYICLVCNDCTKTLKELPKKLR